MTGSRQDQQNALESAKLTLEQLTKNNAEKNDPQEARLIALNALLLANTEAILQMADEIAELKAKLGMV